jgi:hypothetical protein
LQIHSHTLPSFHIPSSSSSREKNPQGHGGQGETTTRGEQLPTKEMNHSRVIFSSHSFLLVSIAILRFTFFDLNLDLLPEEIFGTEETPEYILSDSSAEEEDATPEQRTNHQLRRHIRHLEHDLRDITARYSTEREHRMSLEALVGGKIFILI